MKALQCIVRSVAFWSVAVVAAALGAIGLAGCGGSDTREVQAPPAQKSNQQEVTASGSSGRTAQGASAAMGTTSAGQLRQDLVAGQQQIDRTLASLRKLTDPTTEDLRAAYDDYSSQIVRMNDHADKVRREADAMRNNRNAYFARWEDKVSEIDNPTIRASAEAKRQKLRESHEKIVTTSGQAREAYEPFIRDLQDVRKFLGGDLSRQSVSMLGDVQKKAVASGGTVKEKLAVIIAELDAVETGAR